LWLTMTSLSTKPFLTSRRNWKKSKGKRKKPAEITETAMKHNICLIIIWLIDSSNYSVINYQA
jgi:hypothetical protein